MTNKPTVARLLFPHQLFEAHLHADKATLMILIEDDLFFRQYRFHKQKLLLHRASMQAFKDRLENNHFTVEYLETSSQKASKNRLSEILRQRHITEVVYYDLVDDWLEQAVASIIQALGVAAKRLVSPAFLTTRGQIEAYFSDNPNRMQQFYEWQRKRLNIMVKDDKPAGGRWSFDTENRKKLPKNIELPPPYPLHDAQTLDSGVDWVKKHFNANPGSIESFAYPVTHKQAEAWLQAFLEQRLDQFGPYEDAIAQQHSQLFHSVLSPLLNIGLLTPQRVVNVTVDYADKHDIPIASLEGFIRQIIGWREYMRATYVRFGRAMRTQNYLGFDRTLKKDWWDGTTGLLPVDTVIKRVLKTAYAHHIERLMVVGNAMLLLRIDPDEVYTWFMELFIDAYDWVMVPNVYAMSQFAAGDKITTKPYISGSNYLLKMSDFGRGEWTEDWDALYWQFVADHHELLSSNYRAAMMTKLYAKFNSEKQEGIARRARQWLT